MKKSLLLPIIFSMFLFNYSNAAIFQQISSETNIGFDTPACFDDKSFCFIGNYAVRASGHEKLYVNFAMVCDENQTYCTNGAQVVKTSNFSY